MSGSFSKIKQHDGAVALALKVLSVAMKPWMLCSKDSWGSPVVAFYLLILVLVILIIIFLVRTVFRPSRVVAIMKRRLRRRLRIVPKT